ncbi:sporulation initiation factor Spo0A C-terminal domain-containing protein [Sporosarcina beigongshangi]|uniref:sporulation initiation factor Spo0A C-terminal domain-containing protein n=1 Tax=Sporosarcina beigongshangi TaxID=2782538 RepID=UPI001939A96F|nr:sporulation initiation factor Spo0A C-terminal domain-containing protein [Sporosarcina beigongshangi]
MEVNNAVEEKIGKTFKRIQKAIDYNDYEYILELISDLAEYSYFEGVKRKGLERTHEQKKTKRSNNNTNRSIGINPRISSIVRELGVPGHIKGSNYMKEAIELVHQEPSLLSRFTKDLYPHIAEKNNTTASRVERSIRHAIEVSWKRGSADSILEILGYDINEIRSKPTNSEYIHLVTEYIRKTFEQDRGKRQIDGLEENQKGVSVDGVLVELDQSKKTNTSNGD